MTIDKLDWRQKAHAEGRERCCNALRQLVSSAEGAGVKTITAYNLDPDSKSLLNPSADIEGVHIECHWNSRPLEGVRARLIVGSYSERRAFPVKQDGSCNTTAIFTRVKQILCTRKEEERSAKERQRRQKEDEAREERLAPLHEGVGMIRVECEHGLTKVIVSGLGEEEAKRVIAALADVLRPTPAVGEIWQHRKVQMPSRITSVKGMIKLVGVEKGQTCAIPKREFIEGWELVSAAPESP